MRRALVPLLAFALPAATTTFACVTDDFVDPVLKLQNRGAVARFSVGTESVPGFLDVPFPSDAYMDGGKFGTTYPALERTFKQNATLLATQLGQLSGWSRIAPALFALENPQKPRTEIDEAAGEGIDRNTLPEDEDACRSDRSSVYLIDLEPSDPTAVRIPCRASVLDERDVESGRFLVAIGPARGVVLEEGHRYAAVMTNRLKREDGSTFGASADFTATAVRKEGKWGALYGGAYDKVMAAIGPALASDGATVIALAPYTTQKVTSEMYALRDAMEAAPAPVLSWDPATVAPMKPAKFAQKVGGTLPVGFDASLDDWLGVVAPNAKLDDGSDDPDDGLPVRAHDKIAAIGTGVIQAVNYLRVRDRKYEDLEHATFTHDGAGAIVPAPEKPTAKIWVTFAVPTSPMPPAGYPTVIVQHGLNGSRAYLLSLANRFASKGWIAVAIDSVTFGARSADPKYQVDETSDYTAAPGNVWKGADGISDKVNNERAGSFDFFGSLKNLLALRDQLRQAGLDTVQLVKLLRSNPDLSPLTTGATAPKIDGDRIAYVGDSLGAIEGAIAAAIEPRVKAWTLNVGGGGIIVEAAAHGPAINSNLALAGTVNFGFGAALYTEAHPLVTLAQTMIEAGDPIAYANHLVQSPAPLAGAPTNPRNILQIEVVFDELVANEANEALARAAGYSLGSPNVGLNAGMADLPSRTPYRGGGIKLPILPEAPAGEGYHDIPKPGVTAILIQASPGQHGVDLVRSKGSRSYRIPYNTPDGKIDITRQAPTDVSCPYRALQQTMVRFFGDAFDGRVPVVAGFSAPTRDQDGDGAPDDADPSPLGP